MHQKGKLLKPTAKCAVRVFGAIAAALCFSASYAQPKITSADFFTQTNLFYRAYANKFDPSDTTGGTAYTVPPGVIGNAGPDQLWDFSSGPTNEVLRFDYLSTNDVPPSADYPGAKLVEQEKIEADGAKPQWLFFDVVPGAGRTVYGAYVDTSDSGLFGALGFTLSPESVFNPPILDFPDPMTYGLQWSTTTTYIQGLSTDSSTDPTGGGDTGGFSSRLKTTTSSNFKADAYGTIILPDQLSSSFFQALRVSEDGTLDAFADFGDGQFDHIETDYVRNYYWFVPGYGLVAQLVSTAGSSPVATNFTSAAAFVRMFETNKKIVITTPCTNPAPVTDVRIRVSNGVILLTWSAADCANQYAVQFTSTPADPNSWQPLGNPTTGLVWQGENTQKGPARFYRVVSMK